MDHIICFVGSKPKKIKRSVNDERSLKTKQDVAASMAEPIFETPMPSTVENATPDELANNATADVPTIASMDTEIHNNNNDKTKKGSSSSFLSRLALASPLVHSHALDDEEMESMLDQLPHAKRPVPNHGSDVLPSGFELSHAHTSLKEQETSVINSDVKTRVGSEVLSRLQSFNETKDISIASEGELKSFQRMKPSKRSRSSC